jgi:hypothetical protein
MFHVPEKYRIHSPIHVDPVGNEGAFMIGELRVIAADGDGWEHVSISLANRVPNWEEMCQMKNLFWDKEDCVIQFHPPQNVYVNNHHNVLHLWRKIGSEFETPPMMLV